MANKINVKLILELLDAGMTRNGIASTRHISKNSVSDVMRIAKEKGIAYAAVRDLDEDAAYRMFYPDKHMIENMFSLPDYEHVHEELRRVGVTLKLLWEEYRDKCRSGDAIAMGYTKFCCGYEDYAVRSKITNHLEHKPGIVVEVDWSGPTMSYNDEFPDEDVTVYLFVATLPYSQYSYVEPCLDMKQDTWLLCHVNMFEFFGGSTVRTVCDNLKTGVVRHPKEGDIVLNANYEALAAHYMTAVMPTGVKKPKQKASVEGSVGKIATAIIASLRDVRFRSFAQLKAAVQAKLEEFNGKPFQKREHSRKEVFAEEQQYLRPLPETRYEIAEWVYGRHVYYDCHVVYGKNRYSCPYQHVGKKADLKVTATRIEIYVGGERVATHEKYPSYINCQYSTHKEDLPERFRIPGWDMGRIKMWAAAIGPNADEVVRRIFSAAKIEEQGWGPSLSVLKLADKYSNARLETACEMALGKVRSPRYHHLNAILAADQDIVWLALRKTQAQKPAEAPSGYVRGAEYYGGGGND